MKKSSLVLSLGVALIGFSAFTNISNSDATDQNAKESIINWTATKVIGGGHTGTIEVKESNLKISNGKLTGGTVIANMSTITNTDLEGEWNDKLIGHLNSDDFFSTSKYSTSTIKITKVSPGKDAKSFNVVADLTIKGITNSESFIATVAPNKDTYVVSASIDIDRTKYDVKYGSNSFFDDLGDKAISDNFNLQVTIISPKK